MPSDKKKSSSKKKKSSKDSKKEVKKETKKEEPKPVVKKEEVKKEPKKEAPKTEEPAKKNKLGTDLGTKRIGYEDMTLMENMTLDGVLENLKDRFLEDLMYVSINNRFIFFYFFFFNVLFY